MKINALKDALNKISKSELENDKFLVVMLAKRAEEYIKSNPYDTPVTLVAGTLKKIALRKTFINRNELRELYNCYNNSGSRLKDIFANELNIPELAAPKMMEHTEFDNKPLEMDYDKVADPFLSNALTNLFDNKEVLFSKEAGKRAENACKFALNVIKMPPKQMSVFYGKDGFILCTASYGTSKGNSNILIPVEMVNDKALIPNTFVSTSGFSDLNSDLIKEHIDKTAGVSFKVNTSEVLKVLSAAKHGTGNSIDPLDFACLKIRQKNSNLGIGGILLEKADPTIQKDIEIPKVALAKEDQKLSDSLTNPRGQAEFLFGKRAVESALSLVSRKMT